jgi:hypothetical protein
LDAELGALRQVAESRPVVKPGGTLAEELDPAPGRVLEPEREPQQRRLPAAVRACDCEELALPYVEVDLAQNRRAVRISKLDAVESKG